jgi:DNA-binding NarL/FixJ family response regulator
MTTVLFVDDDKNQLASLRRQVRRMRPEWKIFTAISGADALVVENRTACDVVVTDMSMPGISGLELVRILNGRTPSTECIVLTGTADLETAAEIINTARVSRFFTKPCPIERLAEGIEAALEKRDGLTPVGEDWGTQVLDRLAIAVIITDRRGEALHLNQAAATLIARKDGLHLDHGRICRAASPAESRALLNRIAAVCDGEEGEAGSAAIPLSRPSQRQSLGLVIAATGDHGALLLITDPDDPPPINADTVAARFGLTASESRLACSLAMGKSVEEVAIAMNLTVETIRTYLKRIFAKTGTHRQAELVASLLSSPNLIGHRNVRKE